MSRKLTRRSFLSASAALGLGSALGPGQALGAQPGQALGAQPGQALGAQPGQAVSISSGNGLRAVAKAASLMRAGEDTLDAVVAGVNIIENDPDDMSVGYGGLPNEQGVVELDSCVMHGPSYNAGSVAALEKIKNPSSVARLVMKRTDHVMIVGDGALKFALAHGFRPQDLLTDKARKAWLRWKERLSEKDDWLTEDEAGKGHEARSTGTINCLAVNEKGELSGVTTTSGLAYKIPGRVGDSPIIGAGLYVDNEVGAAGATGRGEAAIISGGSRIICENLRHGLSPEQAILDVLRRVVKQTVDPRLLDDKGRPAFNLAFYCLRKDGAYASGALWSGVKFAVHDAAGGRREDSVYLFERSD